jgi:hypothetical protein
MEHAWLKLPGLWLVLNAAGDNFGPPLIGSVHEAPLEMLALREEGDMPGHIAFPSLGI